MMSIRLVLVTMLAASSTAFVVQPLGSSITRPSTRVYIDRRIADSIDAEFHRQHHRKEFENEWMEKNRGAVLQSLGGSSNNEQSMVSDLEEQHESMRQFAKDKRLAKEDPRRYCAERCISTGHCDVYEDIFDFSPTEVLEFCNDCVLGEGDEPCDIPESFYEKLSP
ncbi:hypothetical protein MPSEU_000451500 [Mayamaea pseudoterrestris]|nr:hypothetical protein MPSEU_000451500 [Mayamaea pseudoterrestris]